ncbi:MAG: flippase [bacterium]|nr:flippase [bacterium]
MVAQSVDSARSKRAVGNAAILTLGAGVETALQFFFLLLAGRELGPEQFGFYGYLLALVTIVSAVVHYGLPVISVREIAQRPADSPALFSATFRIRAVLAVVSFACAVLAAWLLPQSVEQRWAIWLIFAYLLFLPFDLSFLFDAHQASRWDVPGRIGGRVVSVGLLFLLWKIRGRVTVVDVALCSSLLMLVNAGIAWLVARARRLSLPWLSPTREVAGLVRSGTPIMLANVLTFGFSQMQTILVKWFSTALETGYYALASRLLMPLLIFKGVLYRVFFPLISEVAADREALTARLEKLFPLLALIFMPAVGLGIPAAQMILVPLFGAEYGGAVLPFQIAISHMLLTGMGSLFGNTLVATGDERTPTVGLALGCAVSLAAGFALIAPLGATGAALASCGGEFVSMGYCIPKFLRVARPRIAARMIRIGAFSIAGCAMFYAITGWTSLSSGAALVAATLVIAGGLWTSGEISRERLQILPGLFRRVK